MHIPTLRIEVQARARQRDQRPTAEEQVGEPAAALGEQEEMGKNSVRDNGQTVRNEAQLLLNNDLHNVTAAEHVNNVEQNADCEFNGNNADEDMGNNLSDGSDSGDEVNDEHDDGDLNDEGDEVSSSDEGDFANDNGHHDSDGEEREDGEWDVNDNNLGGDLGNKPLYAGAPITVAESVVSILMFMLNHSITATGIEDLLTLIQLHCPQVGFVKLSLNKLKRYFQFSTGPVKKHFYCSVCTQGLNSRMAICHICQQRKPVSYFIQVPLVPQIKKLFARPGFYQNLQHRFTRAGPKVGCIEDIYDALLYEEQVNAGFLASPHNYSFTYFCDGVPVFKSRNYSFWGFYLTVNELPYRMRIKRENTLLAGVWVGPTKPHANLFMNSFIEDFRSLYQGIDVSVHGKDEQVRVRGLVLSGVADTPARSTFMNLVHHNGFYGCPCCEIRGETVHLPSGGDTHCYRYQPHIEKRTLDRMIQQAREATNMHRPVMGVKGPSALMAFVPNFLRGTGIDLMHLLMGIVRKLIKLHFDAPHADSDFSLRPVLPVVNAKLQKMRPPKFIHRLPRSIADWGHWKASELKVWFFYYSVPILESVMRPMYFNHYLKLVTSLSYLNACSVSYQMIDKAEHLLREFVSEFEELYGLRFCSINIHMLLHVADCVRELGPTWVYTCFPYENINSDILRIIHGKTNVDSQISRMHWQCLDFPLKISLVRDGRIKDFCLRKQKQVRLGERVLESCYTVGLYSDRNAGIPLILTGLQNSHINFRRLLFYKRLLKSSLLYVSEMYNRDLKSCSSYAAFQWGENIRHGSIYTFVKVMNCLCDFNCNCVGDHYAIIRCCEKTAEKCRKLLVIQMLH